MKRATTLLSVGLLVLFICASPAVLAQENGGGEDAAALQISEQYIEELRKLAKPETRMILPMNLGDIRGTLDQIQRVLTQYTPSHPGAQEAGDQDAAAPSTEQSPPHEDGPRIQDTPGETGSGSR